MSPTMADKNTAKKILGIDLDAPEWKRSVRDTPTGELRSNKRTILNATQGLLARVETEKREMSNDEKIAFDEGLRIANGIADHLELRKATDEGERSITRAPGQFIETASGERIKLLRPDERMADAYPAESFGVGDVVRGMATGKWPNGEMRDLMGSQVAAGGAMLTPAMSARVIDLARAKTALVQAGAMTVPMESGEVRVACVASDPLVDWRGENIAITPSDATFSALTLTAKTAGLICKVPLELAEDAANLQPLVESIFANAIAVEMDRVGLIGAGLASEPLGLLTTPGVNTATGIGSPVYDDFIDAVKTVRERNGEATAAILCPRDAATLSKLRATAGDYQYLQPPKAYSDLKILTTTLVPKTLGGGTDSCAFVGDFSNLWFAIRTGLRIESSRTAGDSTGSAFGNVQIWIRAYLRMDVAVIRPAHFVVMSGITA